MTANNHNTEIFSLDNVNLDFRQRITGTYIAIDVCYALMIIFVPIATYFGYEGEKALWE